MELVATEDFQVYHDPTAIATPDSAFRQDQDLPIDSVECYPDDYHRNDSPSGSARHSSGADDVFFDKSSSHSSPQTSHQSDDCMSEPPNESRKPSCTLAPELSSPSTTLKHRSPFRNPSSIRAMQMDTTPPPYLPSPSSPLQHKRPATSRSATPRSTRSHYSAMRTASRLNPGKKVKKEYPLVLLHVTVLPANVAFSTEVMESVLPDYIRENWKLLREALTDTVLERGVLIPHPREDYDLLEERLLESLELKLPRILKCGHLHIEPDDEPVESDAEDEDSDLDGADVCADCGRHIRDGRFGSTGTGKRRWDIKIFAANGLMRAGAWAAAWREMERVDVEILPWMDENMRRGLEMRQDEEDQLQAEGKGEEADHGFGNAPREKAGDQRAEGGLDERRRREIYGDHAQAYVDGLYDDAPARRAPAVPQKQAGSTPNVPLLTLVENYLILLARDRRNITIFLLTLLVIFLTTRPMPTDAVPSALRDIADTQSIASATDWLSSAVLPSPGISSPAHPANTACSDEPMSGSSTVPDEDAAETDIPALKELHEAI